MASRPPVECTLCHAAMEPGEDIEEHLVREHSKRQLARHIVTEIELWVDDDVSD